MKDNAGNGYLLKLGDGSTWSFAASPATGRWVKKLGRIMRLKPDGTGSCDHCSRVFFVLKPSRDDAPSAPVDLVEVCLPGSGWEAYDFRSVRLWRHPSATDDICEIGGERKYVLDIVNMMKALQFIYLRTLERGGLPLHSALVERDGMGALAAGPGCAGKSTLCRRLPPPWHAHCDDKSLVVRNGQRGYLAHPLPTWSEYLDRRSRKTWDVERCVPLSALFFIAKAGVDRVVPIGQGEAAVLLYEAATDVCNPITRNLGAEETRELNRLIFENSCRLAAEIPAFILRVSLSGQFWVEMEKVLSKPFIEKQAGTCERLP
jgi:SynChlorMet cassette protein ScmC